MFQLLTERLLALDFLRLLGQAPPAAPPANNNGSIFGNYGFFLPILIVMVLFYFMMVRPQQRERKQMQLMLDNLKKNDRVLLQSGIVGSVVNLQQDAKFVTIKVDESTNTKLKVLRSAIARVITEDEDEEKKKSET
jgi:preprotein translocase subunit YajC